MTSSGTPDTTAATAPAGRWLHDRLVAPGATPGELGAVYGFALAGAVLAAALAVTAGRTPLAVVVLAAVAFDLMGGAVVNSTRSGKRRFHGPGRTARHHLGFVAGHIQPFAVALVVPAFGWTAAAVTYGITLAGALAVLATPAPLRRPVAFGVTAVGTGVALAFAPVPATLAWIAPTMLVKLVLGHLLPEEEKA
jgi:hypothetical protein